MNFEPKDLEILNLVFAQNPLLKEAVLAKIGELGQRAGALAAQGNVKPAELEDRILTWLQARTGIHFKAREIREGLGLENDDKAFTQAMGGLQAKKAIRSSGKRGLGAEYWVG